MHPRLFEIPFIHLTIWSFGLMMVLGFLAGLLLVRRLSRSAGLDPEIMSNAALYALIVGMVGARTFFVVHHFDQFRGDFLEVFAVWRGGLEFLGGAIPAAGFLLVYLARRRLPVRRYLDIMAMGLMMGLAFGRIGCFLNGCCFGKPADLPWALRFPYRSYAYISQINPDPRRARPEPHLRLPQSEYFGFSDRNGMWYPKPLPALAAPQRHEVTQGRFRCRPVHPTQLYACANALLICGILYVFWRKSQKAARSANGRRPLGRPGLAVALTFILYGVGRPLLEAVRDDNPYELGSLTISQILGIPMAVLGLVLLAVLLSIRPDTSGDASVPKDTKEPGLIDDVPKTALEPDAG